MCGGLFIGSRKFELLLLVFALESAALCFITFSGIISIYINGSGSTFTLVIVGAAAGFTVNLDGFAATAIFCTVHSTLAFFPKTAAAGFFSTMGTFPHHINFASGTEHILVVGTGCCGTF
jgi:hypothetical protein